MSDIELKTTYRVFVGVETIDWVDGRPGKPEEVGTIEVKDAEYDRYDDAKAAQIKLSGQTMEIADEQQETGSEGTGDQAQ